MSDWAALQDDGSSVLVIQPHTGDAEAYWAGVDQDPAALVHVQILDEEDEDGERWWHSYVFSTREKAEAYVAGRAPCTALICTLVIDEPEYGDAGEAMQ